VLLEMAQAHNVEMPIAAAVVAVLVSALSVNVAIEGLLMRPVGAE
jgi:glycerol-3-phosphate dehydrogenase (NAD(P)+)